jgi:hypothetical protein
LPLQFVLVESINKFVVTPDEASAKVLTGDDDPGTRGEAEPLFEDAIPLEPIPDVRPEEEG